jgi:hypothetical protein
MGGADGTTDRRAWDSALSVDALAAVQSVGFKPASDFAEAVITGTAVTRVGGRSESGPRPGLAVLRL